MTQKNLVELLFVLIQEPAVLNGFCNKYLKEVEYSVSE